MKKFCYLRRWNFVPALGRGNFEIFAKNRVFYIFENWWIKCVPQTLPRLISEIQSLSFINKEVGVILASRSKHALRLVYLYYVPSWRSDFWSLLDETGIIGKRKNSATKRISRIFDKWKKSRVMIFWRYYRYPGKLAGPPGNYFPVFPG